MSTECTMHNVNSLSRPRDMYIESVCTFVIKVPVVQARCFLFCFWFLHVLNFTVWLLAFDDGMHSWGDTNPKSPTIQHNFRRPYDRAFHFMSIVQRWRRWQWQWCKQTAPIAPTNSQKCCFLSLYSLEFLFFLSVSLSLCWVSVNVCGAFTWFV